MNVVRLEAVLVLCFCCLLALNLHCGPDESGESTEYESLPAVEADLLLFDSGKEDSGVFNPNILIDQEMFENEDFMSEVEIQSFLENTPYGHESFLARYEWVGEKASTIIDQVAKQYGINPIILLTKLQVESSLIFRTVPDPYRMEVAMGCGCPDVGPACANAPIGFGRQVDCAGSLFRQYLDRISTQGETITGWGPGIPRQTSEGITVVPKNAATAALYTYTPWILEGSGGNWLFWNVYRKYTSEVLRGRPNYQWVGSSCQSSTTCNFEGGLCMIAETSCEEDSWCEETVSTVSWEPARDERYGPIPESAGVCSTPCSLYCNDSTTPFTATTFCAVIPGVQSEDDAEGEEGWCLARCTPELFPENNGCEIGFTCGEATRANDPETTKDVCWPDVLLPEINE